MGDAPIAWQLEFFVNGLGESAADVGWKCPKCGERSPGMLDACWHCGAAI